jgi:hypothetical protein
MLREAPWRRPRVRVLFDQGTPLPLRRHLTRHDVVTAYEQGWSTLRNGELLDAAETEGIEVLVTTDTKLKHQQNLLPRKLAIIVLTTTSWPRIEQAAGTVVAAAAGTVVAAVDRATSGTYVEAEIP